MFGLSLMHALLLLEFNTTFNTPVWSPHLQKDIFLIESVQKRFTRNIRLRGNIPFSCYADRLNKLNIKSLQYRRLEFDLILTYKNCYGLVDIAFNDFFDIVIQVMI